ncbi:MAG: rhamnulokinase [Candidatus Hydrogenedentes bacterium]|nr:rhamnulokinase [Candidatus Hydrogenedentota bacterium]
MGERTGRYLAFDLGAESGRAILGTYDGHTFTLQEIHRFRTEGLIMLGVRQWDLARIYEEFITALRRCAQEFTPELDAIGIDTWGVDFGLIGQDGQLVGNPIHYRDSRTEGMFDAAFRKVPRADLYRASGIQFLPFNTSFQLLSLVEREAAVLQIADKLLLMPDLLAYLLTGKMVCEYTNASTTQLLDPHTRTWNEDLIARLGIPRHLFLPIVAPGHAIGTLLPAVAALTGIGASTPVIAPATHDTGSAVAAVPVTGADQPWAYLSSGTWSLLGAELAQPCITEESLQLDFTNEGGVQGTIRFLKNIFGLWLVQECRRTWEREGQTVDYETMTREARESAAFRSIIDLDDPRLFAPENMPALIQTLCRERQQPAPETRGQIVRCALESLALKYRKTLRDMDRVLGRRTEKLHIIGGGVQNRLLCEMTANACGVPVITGPVEATVLGNLGVQAMATGAIGSLAEMRAAIARSFATERIEPTDSAAWDAVAGRL